METKKFIIGIDGGIHTGFAVWDTEEKTFTHISTTNFWDVFNLIEEFLIHITALCAGYPQNKIVIYVEDPAQNKPVWRRHGMKDHEYQKKCQSVGGVKRETTLLIEGLRIKGYEVKAIRPQKGSHTKMKADAFKKLTKYEGRTSEHGRDAAMLVFQRNN